jgi:hypothetical protein
MHRSVISAGTQNFVVVLDPAPSSTIRQNPSMLNQNHHYPRQNPSLILAIRPKPVSPIHPISSISSTPRPTSPLVHSEIPFKDHGTIVPEISGKYKCFFAVLIQIFGSTEVLKAFDKFGGKELFKGDIYFTASNNQHVQFAIKMADYLEATFAIYVKYSKGWTRSPIITLGTGHNFVPFGLFPGDHKVLGHFVHITNVSELDITVNPQQLQQEIFDFFLGSPEETILSNTHDSRFDPILAQMFEANPNLDFNATKLELEKQEKEKEKEKEKERETIEKELAEVRKQQEAQDLVYASQLQTELDNQYVVERINANPQADVGQVLAQLQQMKM